MKNIPLFLFSLSHWALRPLRAMQIAYGHVLRGTKVQHPLNWKDI